MSRHRLYPESSLPASKNLRIPRKSSLRNHCMFAIRQSICLQQPAVIPCSEVVPTLGGHSSRVTPVW
jgi:hypothetical protein